jgi:hypothetical protein
MNDVYLVIMHDGRQVGPMSLSEIEVLIRQRLINEASQVMKNEKAPFKAAMFPELSSLFESSPHNAGISPIIDTSLKTTDAHSDEMAELRDEVNRRSLAEKQRAEEQHKAAKEQQDNTKQFEDDIKFYKSVRDNPISKDLVERAWTSLLNKWNVNIDSVPTDDLNTFREIVYKSGAVIPPLDWAHKVAPLAALAAIPLMFANPTAGYIILQKALGKTVEAETIRSGVSPHEKMIDEFVDTRPPYVLFMGKTIKRIHRTLIIAALVLLFGIICTVLLLVLAR